MVFLSGRSQKRWFISIYTHPFLNAYRFYSDPKTEPLLPDSLQPRKATADQKSDRIS